MSNAINNSPGQASHSFVSFLAWLVDQHKILLGRLHVHNPNCYGVDKNPICGYATGAFEPLCVPPESLVTMFVSQKKPPAPGHSFLVQLEMGVRNAELRVRKIPTEQDILRALNAWQPHPGLTSQESDCIPGTCFCCDTARELSLNTPFMVTMHSIAEQLGAGETQALDALTSAFAFGILTAQFMQRQVQ